MQTITLKVPDSFTEEQVNFIKNSAANQIEAEMKKVLAIPQEDIDAVEVEVDAVKEAMGIVKPVEEPIEPPKPFKQRTIFDEFMEDFLFS
jgi:hypothetical protein